MANTLLVMVQDVVNEIGSIAAPSTVIGNTDSTVKQLLALANREVRELAARTSNNEGWPALRKEHMFSTTVVTGLTGNTTSGSAVVSGISSTASLAVGYGVVGTGIRQNTHILTVDSGTQVTLDYTATATGTAVSLTFGKDAYSFPSDIGYWINRTAWDRTRSWELVGPTTPTEWQFLKSGYPGTGFLYRYRIYDDKLVLDPIPTSTSNMVLEYYSRFAVVATNGTTEKATFTVDSDEPLLDDQLVTMGIKWRFLRAKGLDYQQEYRTYEDAVERALGRAGLGRTLHMGGGGGQARFVNLDNAGDTGYGD